MKNKSLFAILLGAAAVALAVSPQGRKAIRKFAVKGTGAWFELKDQVKELTSDLAALQIEGKKDIEDPVPSEL
ncbi:hypothetical protein [Paenibacillus planticolens]|uniref:YtxH domain-containing protein n=1 Tax=Paenibacillus planticolens TaxID=2654976 RepID=A0ABX1ZZ52_9BACL|nr:hypothetical protein [Paenibacillus planticolens]NOV04340.1 hypothetical protein [Paenibacillus planticolens]